MKPRSKRLNNLKSLGTDNANITNRDGVDQQSSSCSSNKGARDVFLNSSTEGSTKSSCLPDIQSPFRTLTILEKRFDKLSADLTVKLQNLFDSRQEDQMAKFKSLLIDFENHLISEFDKKMLEIRSELDRVADRVTTLEAVSDELQMLKDEMKSLKLQASRNENSLVACDLRLNGIPHRENENLPEIFDSICKAINVPTPAVKSIYRLRTKNKAKNDNIDAVVIVKLFSPYEKNMVLKSLGLYKKQNNNKLLLNLLGFESNRYADIRENLSNSNYKILREALAMKRKKLLFSAYTYRGLVYVKQKRDDDPICIEQFDGLNFFREHPLCSNNYS